MWFYHDQGSRDIWGKYRRSACLNHSPCRGKRLGWLFTMICAAGKHSEAGTEAACQGPMLPASCAVWHSPYSDCVSYSRCFLERWTWVSGICTMEDKFEQKFMRALGRFSSRHLSWFFVPDEWSSLLTCSTFLVNGLYSMCCLDSEGIFTHLERFGKWLEGAGRIYYGGQRTTFGRQFLLSVVESWDWTQVVKFIWQGKSHYPLSHLTGPRSGVFTSREFYSCTNGY